MRRGWARASVAAAVPDPCRVLSSPRPGRGRRAGAALCAVPAERAGEIRAEKRRGASGGPSRRGGRGAAARCSVMVAHGGEGASGPLAGGGGRPGPGRGKAARRGAPRDLLWALPIGRSALARGGLGRPFRGARLGSARAGAFRSGAAASAAPSVSEPRKPKGCGGGGGSLPLWGFRGGRGGAAAIIARAPAACGETWRRFLPHEWARDHARRNAGRGGAGGLAEPRPLRRRR